MARAAQARNQRTAKAAALAEPEPESEPEMPDIEQERLQVLRKVEIILSDWRRCPRPRCRRQRACEPPQYICYSPRRPPREMTPEQEARSLAQLKRMLERRQAELRGEADEVGAAAPISASVRTGPKTSTRSGGGAKRKGKTR